MILDVTWYSDIHLQLLGVVLAKFEIETEKFEMFLIYSYICGGRLGTKRTLSE